MTGRDLFLLALIWACALMAAYGFRRRSDPASRFLAPSIVGAALLATLFALQDAL